MFQKKGAIDCTICNKKYPSWWMNTHLQKQHPGTVIPVPSSSSMKPSYSTEELLSMQGNPHEDTLLFDQDTEQENKDFEEYLKEADPLHLYIELVLVKIDHLKVIKVLIL